MSNLATEIAAAEVVQDRLAEQKTQHTQYTGFSTGRTSADLASTELYSETATLAAAPPPAPAEPEAEPAIERPPKDSRFWMILVALCVTCLAQAAEGTITSTALPTIAADLNIGDEFVWVPNAFLLTR